MGSSHGKEAAAELRGAATNLDLKGAANNLGAAATGKAASAATGLGSKALNTTQGALAAKVALDLVKMAVSSKKKTQYPRPKNVSQQERADFAMTCFKNYGELPGTKLALILTNQSELFKLQCCLENMGDKAPGAIRALYGSWEAAVAAMMVPGRDEDEVSLFIDMAYTKEEATHNVVDLSELQCSLVKSSVQFQTEIADIIPASKSGAQTLIDGVKLTGGWFRSRQLTNISLEVWKVSLMGQQSGQTSQEQQPLGGNTGPEVPDPPATGGIPNGRVARTIDSIETRGTQDHMEPAGVATP